MPSALSTYAFINAKLRARISKLLDRKFFEEMARARSVSESIGLLVGTRYAAVVETYRATGDLKLCELEVTRVEHETLTRLDRYVPDSVRPFAQALLRDHELTLLKNAIRLWFERVIRGRVIDDKVAYLLREELSGVPADAIINATDADDLANTLKNTEYGSIVAAPPFAAVFCT